MIQFCKSAPDSVTQAVASVLQQRHLALQPLLVLLGSPALLPGFVSFLLQLVLLLPASISLLSESVDELPGLGRLLLPPLLLLSQLVALADQTR